MSAGGTGTSHQWAGTSGTVTERMDHDMERSIRTRATTRLLMAGASMALLALATVGTSALAQSASPEADASAAAPGKPNIVLVHGAWADGSSWSKVIGPLQEAGYNVTAVQIPLTSIEDDVATVRNVLTNQTGPTILVAHSYGGAVITELGADAPNVVGLVYIAAFAPDEGETAKGLTSAEPAPAGVAAIRPDAAGNLWLDPAGFLQWFAPDVDPAEAKVMAAVQKPIAASTFLSEALLRSSVMEEVVPVLVSGGTGRPDDPARWRAVLRPAHGGDRERGRLEPRADDLAPGCRGPAHRGRSRRDRRRLIGDRHTGGVGRPRYLRVRGRAAKHPAPPVRVW